MMSRNEGWLLWNKKQKIHPTTTLLCFWGGFQHSTLLLSKVRLSKVGRSPPHSLNEQKMLKNSARVWPNRFFISLFQFKIPVYISNYLIWFALFLKPPAHCANSTPPSLTNIVKKQWITFLSTKPPLRHTKMPWRCSYK